MPMAHSAHSINHPRALQAQEADCAAILSRTASGWVLGGASQLACTVAQLVQRHAWAMRDSRAQQPCCRGPVLSGYRARQPAGSSEPQLPGETWGCGGRAAARHLVP